MDHFAGLDVVHGVQTNATLVDEEWADFLAERRINVGVSIDGPPEDNQQRVDWSGRSAFARIVRGIRLLVAREIVVSVIAVVSDPTPERARKLYAFVVELGATWLGVNIEEMEGGNNRRTAPPESQVTDFWTALIKAWQANPVVRLREADRALSYVGHVLNDGYHDKIDHTSTSLDPLPTITWDGGVTLISPELAGFRSDRYGDFSCGNVLRTPLSRLIRTGMQEEWVREYRRGISECRMICPYFETCHPRLLVRVDKRVLEVKITLEAGGLHTQVVTVYRRTLDRPTSSQLTELHRPTLTTIVTTGSPGAPEHVPRSKDQRGRWLYSAATRTQFVQ